jgi:hypothetical protein
MTVELGGFWRKPTDVGERLEEVPRRLKGFGCAWKKGEVDKFFFSVRGRRSDS